MHDQPLVSVVIPAWNHARELMHCLDSVEAQTYRPTEIIVIDDGSTDETEELLEARMNRSRGGDPPGRPYTIIRWEKNRGAAAARNEGARHAHGEFLLFADADAILVKDAVSRMVETLAAHPEAAFVYSSFRFGWKLFRGRPFDASALRLGPYIHTTALLRRDAFPGFDESLKKFQDWDLWLSVVGRGGVGIWIDDVLFMLSVGRKGMSRWLPSFFHRLPWHWIGWMPGEVKNYRKWERVVKEKHGIETSEQVNK